MINQFDIYNLDLDSQIQFLINYEFYQMIYKSTDLPTFTGVYVFVDMAIDQVVYVGKSFNIKNRLHNSGHTLRKYIAEHRDSRYPSDFVILVKEVDESIMVCEESLLIGLLRPSLNFPNNGVWGAVAKEKAQENKQKKNKVKQKTYRYGTFHQTKSQMSQDRFNWCVDYMKLNQMTFAYETYVIRAIKQISKDKFGVGFSYRFLYERKNELFQFVEIIV